MDHPVFNLPSTPRPPRVVALDALRLLGALGVVWLHTISSPPLAQSNVFGRFGVPLFAAAAAYFCVESALRKPRPFGEYTRSRAARLLLPFAAWSVIYLGLRELKPLLIGGTSNVQYDWAILWNGPALQLWFLPFIFVMTLVLYVFARAARGVPTAGAVVLAMVGTALLFTKTNWLAEGVTPRSVEASRLFMPMLGLDCMGALLLGAALALWLNGRSLAVVIGSSWRAVGVGCMVGAVLVLTLEYFCDKNQLDIFPPPYITPGRTNWPENVAGILLLVAGLLPFQGRVWTTLAWLGTAAFGIYLCHFVFVDAMKATAPALLSKVVKGVALSGTAWWDIVSFVVAVVASVLLTWLLLRSWGTRWLVT